jgi:hypothetical protein
LPAQESNQPLLNLGFTSTEGRNGSMYFQRSADGKKFYVRGGGTLPVPNTATIFGEYPMEGYEESVSRILQRLVEAQVLQQVSPTPTPVPTASPTPTAASPL